jgi:hypothetical protein
MSLRVKALIPAMASVPLLKEILCNTFYRPEIKFLENVTYLHTHRLFKRNQYNPIVFSGI